MKYAIILAVTAALNVNALPQAKCEKTTDIKPKTDPLVQFAPNTATFPCNMGAAIPFGKVPTGCAKLEIIVARGTSEPGDLGMVVGDPLVARVKRDLPGVEVRGYPVQYPASFLGSGTGVSDIQNRIESQSKECPDEKFVLAGYSQGGMVVSSTLSKIPEDLTHKIIAIVLYGAGDGKSLSQPLGTKALANCAPGDFACPSAGTGEGHVSYNTQGTVWHDRSSQYIVAAYKGQSLGPKLMRSPTDPLKK